MDGQAMSLEDDLLNKIQEARNARDSVNVSFDWIIKDLESKLNAYRSMQVMDERN
jgi:hypothetical protein